MHQQIALILFQRGLELAGEDGGGTDRGEGLSLDVVTGCGHSEEREGLCWVELLECALDLDGLGNSQSGLSGADRNGFSGGHYVVMVLKGGVVVDSVVLLFSCFGGGGRREGSGSEKEEKERRSKKKNKVQDSARECLVAFFF